MIDSLSDLRHQVQTGTCSTFVPAFTDQLRAQGYAANSIKLSIRLINDYASWLDQRGTQSQSLSAAHATDYLNERWLYKRRRRGDVSTLRAFDQLVAPDGYKLGASHDALMTPSRQVRLEFEHYLLHDRGLAVASIRLYGDTVGRFLGSLFSDSAVQLDQLVAVDVIRFVTAEAARMHHPKRAKVMTTALRSFLQYGRYRGEIVTDLHSCVPTVANWSKSGIPRTITPVQVQRMLGACDRPHSAGVVGPQ